MSYRRATSQLGLLVCLATCCCSCSGKGGEPHAATADRGSQARPASVSPAKYAPVKSDGSTTPQSEGPSPSLVGTWRLATIDGKGVKEVDESQTNESLPNRYLVFTPDGQVEAYSLFVNTRLPSSEVTVPRAAHMDVERCDFREGKAHLPLPRGQNPLTGEAPPPGGKRLSLRSESPSVAYEYERLGPGERLPVVYRHPRVRATWLSRKVTSTETDPKLLTELGRALREVGDHPRALAAFDRAIERDPADVGLYRERADLLCSDQTDSPDYEKAVADLDRVIQSRPQDADALAERGLCRMRMAVIKATRDPGVPPSAREVMAQSEAGRLDPADEQLRLALGDFEAALKIEPGCFRALVNRCALSLLTDTKLDPAARDALAALKVNPESARVDLLMAALLIRNGLPPSAKPFLEKAIALEPTNVAPYVLIARISAAGGDLFTTGKSLAQIQVLTNLSVPVLRFHSARLYYDWGNPHDMMGQVPHDPDRFCAT
jgi:tetratricopeptide (TPR) repeat protein